jgi:hypothetical protein
MSVPGRGREAAAAVIRPPLGESMSSLLAASVTVDHP